MSVKIHNLAAVDKTAQLGENVEIAPFAVIGPRTKIGDGCYIGPHCVLEHVEMGKNNELVAACYVGLKPQDFSYKDAPTMVLMGDNNIIREAATIHRSTDVNAPTKVGSNCMLMATSHIAHDCQIGDGVILVNSAGLAGHITVEDKAIISGLCAAHQWCRIGTMAIISGATGIHKDIAPYCMAQGYRAGLVGLNLVGLRRNGLSRETIKSIKDTYKILFLNPIPFTKAIAQAEAQAKTPEAQHMVNFCQQTKRGMAMARINMSGEEE